MTADAYLVSWNSLGRGHCAAYIELQAAEACRDRNHGVMLPLRAAGIDKASDALAWLVRYRSDDGATLQAVMLDRTPAQTAAARLHGMSMPLVVMG